MIKDLPESLRIDIRYYLFSGIIKTGFFPSEEQGAIRSIIQKCRVSMHCAQEEIITEGELGLEMYFILEGEVKIIKSDKVELNTLTEGNVFGEMALLTPFPTARGASVIAKTNVTLAVLSMADFNFVMGIYPEFASKVRIQASQREQMNRNLIHSANLKAIRNDKKLSLLARNSKELDKTCIMKNEHENVFSNVSINTLVKVKNNNRFLKFHNLKIKNIVYFAVWALNIVFDPLYIAFEFDFSYILPLEIITTTVYLVYAVYYYNILRFLKTMPTETSNFYFPKYSKNFLVLKIFHQLLLALPYFLILYE